MEILSFRNSTQNLNPQTSYGLFSDDQFEGLICIGTYNAFRSFAVDQDSFGLGCRENGLASSYVFVFNN